MAEERNEMARPHQRKATVTKGKPRSAVIPVLLTILVLCALTWRVTSFERIQVRIDRLDATGSPPLLQQGREYVVEGVADDGDNPYKAITSLTVQLYTRQHGAIMILGSARIPQIDSERRRFVGRVRVGEGFGPTDAVLAIIFADNSGRSYSDIGSEWPGCAIRVRVE
jgi:hypothetical protein